MGNTMFRVVFRLEIFGKKLIDFARGSVPNEDTAFQVVNLTGVVLTAGITIKVLVG